MIYLPAAGRTTRNLQRAGLAAAGISGVMIVAITTAELQAATGHGVGAHRNLYAGAFLTAVVAASLLSFAYARHLIGQTAEASRLEQARTQGKLADLIAVDQRREYENGVLAAEVADLAETNRQLVAESARWRAAERERADVVEAMALVVEKLGVRLDELERASMRAMIVPGTKVTPGGTKLIQMPSAETVRAARNLASRMIAAERRLHEDSPEDNQN